MEKLVTFIIVYILQNDIINIYIQWIQTRSDTSEYIKIDINLYNWALTPFLNYMQLARQKFLKTYEQSKGFDPKVILSKGDQKARPSVRDSSKGHNNLHFVISKRAKNKCYIVDNFKNVNC